MPFGCSDAFDYVVRCDCVDAWPTDEVAVFYGFHEGRDGGAAHGGMKIRCQFLLARGLSDNGIGLLVKFVWRFSNCHIPQAILFVPCAG